MKFTFAILLFFSLNTFASTRFRFLPFDQQGMVMLDGGDVSALWNAMNVPVQDSFIGKGKAIVTKNKPQDFSMVCSLEKSLCQVVLSKSARTKISSAEKVMAFVVTGPEAAILTKQFFTKADGTVEFKSSDMHFSVSGTNDRFEFRAAP